MRGERHVGRERRAEAGVQKEILALAHADGSNAHLFYRKHKW